MIPQTVFEDNLQLCLQHDLPQGSIVECGVWRGGMSAALAEVLGNTRHYHLFDSFEGLPEVQKEDGLWAKKWQEDKDLWYFDNCKADEQFAQEAMQMAHCEHYFIHKGWFKDSLPHFKEAAIAVLRLDGDWYESTYQCLEYLYPKVADQGLIIIDDYYVWEGCIRAVYDYFSKNHITDRIKSSPNGVCYIIKNEAFPFSRALKNRAIVSPIDSSFEAKPVKWIPGQHIKELYKNLNISLKNFPQDSHIGIYECEGTKYRFFYPNTLAGDGAFYEQLQAFDWYYMPWKWEHQKVKEAIKQLGNSLRILEVGCAKGSFIAEMSKQGHECTGLELNTKALHEAQALSLRLLPETIQAHALQHAENYDVVCSFQVMEHIPDIGDALEASVKVLKKGGKLFISVPNNASFLGLDHHNALNFPPHHMGLWEEVSLKKIAPVFGLKLDAIYLEPLQEYHKEYFNHILHQHLETSYATPLREKYGVFGKLAFKLLKKVFLKRLYIKYPQIESFTIVAQYTKL